MTKAFIFAIKLYQILGNSFRASWLFPVQSQCRFYPSCSEYAVMAVEKDGFHRGFTKSIRRFLRCNPLFKGGVDLP